MEALVELKKLYERQIGKKEQVEADIIMLQSELKDNRKKVKNLEKAHEIVKIVGGETQQQLQYHISDITSLALESVFPNPYKLIMNFIERRGKIECDLLFERDGNIIKPINSGGFGAVDVAALALRVALWSMQMPRTRPTLLLDEPFKHLSAKHHEAASQMVKELSDKLGIQFIISTHIPILSEYADKVFEVKLKNKVSHVKQIN
jgi:DNA repair exonuclease SbcCD ATPase subunit